MNELRFDALARALSNGSATRRKLTRGLVGAAISAGVAAFAWDDGTAKKRCPSCKKRKKGKCKGRKPDGSACPGGTCQSGSCIAAAAPSDPPPNSPPPGPPPTSPLPGPPPPIGPPPVMSPCVAADCPDPGPCKVRECVDNRCAPVDAPNGTSCGSNRETCLGGLCCPSGHQNCFGLCIPISCQGSLAGGCDAACLFPGSACCDRLVCRETASGQLRCRA